MREVLESELVKIKKFNPNIDESHAFELLMCILYCLKDFELERSIMEAERFITNGPDDGGIDFAYFDDDDNKVIIGQCKFVNKFTPNELISELNKMSTTIENFKIRKTGHYNPKLREVLQNSLDALPDEGEYNIEYKIFVACEIDTENYYNKVEDEQNIYTKDMVTILSLAEIISKINDYISNIDTVSQYRISIDKANNILKYSNKQQEGIMVNISNISLIDMYNKFKNNGLFDLNIRKYIVHKSVDDGIKETLNKERENFWFLNNGIIIACKEFDIDGDKIWLSDFSIVNGGQTTNRIGEYKGNNKKEFFIPCKIIANKSDNEQKFYTKIAEATNSQKPITPRDLKSNSPEMRQLKHWLANEGVNLEIKRGEKRRRSQTLINIKNDELGQIILSFIYQQPGTARSGKKKIFENDTSYNKIYRKSYEKDINKKKFLLDLINLYKQYGEVEKKLKEPKSKINNDEKVILGNGKCMIFAIFGLLYRYVNNDLHFDDLINSESREIIGKDSFQYGAFISNYTQDDYLNKLENLIIGIVRVLNESYITNKGSQNMTSVSNYFKTDAKYKDFIIKAFVNVLSLDFSSLHETLLTCSKILCRD